eukprot:COSAG02_NODE_1498_length_12281_cov_14.846741_15_plen_79_part_00
MRSLMVSCAGSYTKTNVIPPKGQFSTCFDRLGTDTFSRNPTVAAGCHKARTFRATSPALGSSTSNDATVRSHSPAERI